MAREFHGKIPKIPIDADTSKADAKVDRLFKRVEGLQHIEIDADISQAQRRLEALAKRSSDKLSSALVGTMLSDFKKVLGAMKTEYENFGNSSDIYKNLAKTCDMVEERFSNLTISIDKKKISGLENILNRVDELQRIDSFGFDNKALQHTVKDTEVVLSKVKEAKKEITSIAGKIDYITKTLNKNADNAFSTKKLQDYKDKIQGLRDELHKFYSIDDELIQNSLVNAAAKINEALGEIEIRMPKVKGSADILSTGETLKELGAVEKKLQAIQEVSNRISKNSSINGLKNIEQEAVNVTKVLAEMYDEGIRDTERYITLQYKLSKIFDKMGKSYGGVRKSGAKDSSQLMDLVIDGIAQKTGINLFSDKKLSGVMENLFGDSDFSLFNKSLSKLAMKDVAELLLITGKTGDWVDMQRQVTAEVEKTTDAYEKTADVVLRTQKEINEELQKEEQKLKDIEKQQDKNEAARKNFKKMQENYGKEVMGVDHVVYDTDLLKGAAREIKEFNEMLETRNKFQEKYIKLCQIIEKYYINDKPGKYAIGNGMYKDLDKFFELNPDIRQLERYSNDGQKTTNKAINELFKNVVRDLTSEYKTVERLIASGEVSGALIGQDLDREETNLGREQQRLHEERQAQLGRIADLRKEELDLIMKQGKEEVKATKEATEAKRKYYEIDEKAARLSKQMRSFDDYKEGSATASYKAAVDELAAIVEEKKKQFPDKADKLDQWLDRYAKNLAAYINRDNQIGAQYPSVMISGAGNYNIKKHNKQMASWGKNYQYYDEKVLAIENKIKNLGSSGSNVIRGDEEDALEKLEARLEYMKYWHEVMVDVNKYYRKNKTLEGFDGVEPDELERIKKDLAVIKQVGMYDTPYPSYALTNDSQNIKRLEDRVNELKRLKDNDGLQEENDIYKLWTDKKDMRIRISFEMGKPDQEVIDMLKGKSFKWSPKNDAWQRQLTDNAVYATKQLQKSLHTFYNIEDQAKSATAVIEEQIVKTEQLAEARLKLTLKKDGSGIYTAMDGKYEVGQDADGWKVWQRDNAGLWNLIGTYKSLEDVRNDATLLTREEIVLTDEVVKEVKSLHDAYESMDHMIKGRMPVVNKYLELLDKVKSNTMSAADAVGQLNEAAGVKSVSAPVDPLEHLVNSLKKLESIGNKPFNEIVRSIADGSATISSEVQDILKDLNLLNEAGQFTGNFITEGMNNSGVITNGKYAVIARTQEHYDESESYEYDFKDGTTYIDNLIAKEKEAAEQGVNLARVLARVKSEVNTGEDLFYEIQEFVPGDQLHIFSESKKNIQDFEQECAKIVRASREHIEKLMSDLIKLNDLGFYIDFSPANILYDTTEGFKFIDLSLRDLGTSAQTTTELMSGLFTCLTALEDSGDRISLGSDESMRWQTAMLSVYNKLSTVFGQNNFGADLSDVMSDFYSRLSEYAGFTNNLTDANKKLTSSYEEVAEAQKEVVETSKGLSKMTFGSSGETLAGTTPISFKYAVMSVEDLVMSHDAYGTVNPQYPEELQPRDRNRIASKTQILQMVKNIIPELLTASPTAQNGSPIVSNDGIVVGGNARSAALSEAYTSGLADGYRTYITEHASEFGLDANNMPNNPVLVRVVDIDGGLDVLAKQLNESTTAGYSTTEQALINEELVMKVISKLNIDESANLNSEANKDFVKSFISLLSDSQKNEMMTKDGSLSAIGLVKVKQALVGAAYGSREMLENLEQISPELLNISNALTAGAAKAAEVRYDIESGNLNDVGVISTLLKGVDLLKTARRKDQDIDGYLNQLSLFESDYAAEDVAIGRFLEANVRNATQLKNMVDTILDFAKQAGDPNQISFAGLEDLTLSSLIKGAFEKYAEKYGKDVDYNKLTEGFSSAQVGSRSDKRIDRIDVAKDIQEENKLLEEQGNIAQQIVEQTEVQAAAEEKVAEEANKAADAKERQVEASQKAADSVSVEEIIARNVNEALEQLRSAKNNETTLFSLKGVFEGDDLVDQARAMVENIAEQSNLSLGKFNVKDDTVKVQLYNEELKVTVDQMYKLRAATEDMDSAQLELVSQSFVQNVKALNENNFDVEGVQQRALAAIEKVRSSLHGLEYDLTDLESVAKSISSQDDFNKFSNQLKAAQDNIQAIKNSTVSKNSMNPLANMQRDMQNANIEIETMRLKLEKFGDIQGVAEAKQMLEDMAKAAQSYGEATDAKGQQSAYNEYSNLRSSFKAQTEYINAAKSLNDSQKSEEKRTNPVKEQYQSILDLVNKINTANERMVKFQQMDGGSGLLAKQIGDEQAKKLEAVEKLNSVMSELNVGNVLGSDKYALPDDIKSIGTDYSQIAAFINDAGVQASLTTTEIEKLVKALVKAGDIDLSMISEALNAGNIKERAKKVAYENQYFADKTNVSLDADGNTNLKIEEIQKIGAAGNTAKEKLEGLAQAIAKNSEGAVALTKDFSQGADGIARLDFSVFDKSLGSLRDFRIELGTTTGQIAVYDTTISKSLANIKAANNQLKSTGNLLGTLNASGVHTENDGGATPQVQKVLNLVEALQNALNTGADQNVITKLTKDLRMASTETDKFYKQMLQMESAIESGSAKDLGKIDPSADIYGQLAKKAQELASTQSGATLELGRFDATTNTLNASLVHANGTVEQFKVSMYGLGGECAAQQAGVTKLTTSWDRFKTSIFSAGKQLLTAFAGYNVFYKVIAEVRKGIGYVKEIDLALTELKKVTDETEESYRKFLDTAAGSAGEIGSTVSDFTEATANFARLNI